MKLFINVVAFALIGFSVQAAEAKKEGMLFKADKAVSGQRYGTAGCGLGSIVMGAGGGFNQVFAATTNGTSGTQTFGISTGTSNCAPSSSLSSSNRVTEFAAANRMGLETDIARGSGESLTALSTLMGCNSQKLGAGLQKNYGRIFDSAKTNDQAASEIVSSSSSYCS